MRIVKPESESESMKKTKSTGQQIQSISDFLCGLGWFISVLWGVVLFAKFYILAVIIVAVCCYGIWASTRILQGFGELLDETTANRANTDRILFVLESMKRDRIAPAANEPTESE